LLKKEQIKNDSVIIGFEGLSRTILVVDDKWENCLVLINLLKPLGFEVIEARNGKEYLEMAQQKCPDLIVTDLVMPVIDGFEATRQVRKIPTCQDVPIIAASASVFDADQKTSLEAGCNDFINKPIHVEELLEKLRIHLDLTWIYERETGHTTENIIKNENTVKNVDLKQTTELQGPSAEQSAILFDLAMMGDIAEIVEKVTELEQAEPQLAPFCQKIRQLAKAFDEEKICQLIEQYL
jgi:CheY-like chemotaxis protein